MPDWLRTMTFALGMIAPDWSRTKPEIVPRSDCAKSVNCRESNKTQKHNEPRARGYMFSPNCGCMKHAEKCLPMTGYPITSVGRVKTGLTHTPPCGRAPQDALLRAM